MTSKAQTYIVDALAASGLAVVHHEAAAIVRPGYWLDGIEARGDLASSSTRVFIGSMPGVRQFVAELPGISGEVPVLARSADQLATRIEWVTGLACTKLRTKESARVQDAGPVVPRKAPTDSNDRHAGVVTAEQGRTCSSCDRLTVAGLCSVPAESGLSNPAQRSVRRCLGYTPIWGADDVRAGRQLWPELAP